MYNKNLKNACLKKDVAKIKDVHFNMVWLESKLFNSSPSPRPGQPARMQAKYNNKNSFTSLELLDLTTCPISSFPVVRLSRYFFPMFAPSDPARYVDSSPET